MILAQSHQETEDIEVKADHSVRPIVEGNEIRVYAADVLGHQIVVPDHLRDLEKAAAEIDIAVVAVTGRHGKRDQCPLHQFNR